MASKSWSQTAGASDGQQDTEDIEDIGGAPSSPAASAFRPSPTVEKLIADLELDGKVTSGMYGNIGSFLTGNEN